MTASFAHFKRVLQTLAATSLLTLGACASTPPPTAELSMAEQALARASDADAEQYAPDLLEQARTALTQAQAAMAARKAADARALAANATAAADLARARSVEEKTNGELTLRRNELVELRQRLRLEETP